MPKKEKEKEKEKNNSIYKKNWQFLRKIRNIAIKYIFPFSVLFSPHFGEILHREKIFR
jgi:hypothetical protein